MRVTGGHLAATMAAVLVLAIPGAASAAPVWVDEPLDSAASSIAIAPDGTGLFFGFPAPVTNYPRFAVRPAGGPLGAPQDFPPGISTPTAMAFAPNGDAILATTPRVAFRPAGATSAIGAPQVVTGLGPLTMIAVTTTGDALVGSDDFLATSGHARVAFRPAGPAGQVDVANLQTFTDGTGHVRLIGLALDPDGGAIAVLEASAGLLQAVRPPGEASFHTPTPIGSPAGLDAETYRTRFAASPDGHAVLAWIGSTTGTPIAHDRIVATQRAPGGGFDAPQVIASESLPNSDFGAITPAMAAGGDGMVFWSQPVLEHATCVDSQAMTRTLHGGGFGPLTAIGLGAFPKRSYPVDVAGAGDRVAVVVDDVDHGGSSDACDSTDVRSQLRVQIYKRGVNGLALEEERVVAASVPALPPSLTNFTQPALTPVGLRLGASGTLTVGTTNGNPAVRTLHVREDLSPAPAPAPPVGGGPFPPAGAASPKPAIKPITPRDLVLPKPIIGAAPKITTLCPPAAGSECVMHLALYAKLGIVPKAAAAGKAVLYGRVRVRLKAGQRKSVRFKLTRAGRKAALGRKAGKTRMVIDATYGGKTRRAVVTVRIGGKR